MLVVVTTAKFFNFTMVTLQCLLGEIESISYILPFCELIDELGVEYFRGLLQNLHLRIDADNGGYSHFHKYLTKFTWVACAYYDKL